MKKIFLKILKAIFYFIGGAFILSSIINIFDGGGFLIGIFSIFFGALMLPIIYSKIKNYIYKYNPKLSFFKFIFSYILIVFIGYFSSFGMLIENVATKQTKEKEKIENMTKLNANYNINDKYTIKDELEIKLNYSNIEALKINDKEIEIKDNSLTYKFPLKLGINNISIIGINKGITRKITKTIIRETLEEQKRRIEKEEKQKELEKIKREEEKKAKKEAEKRQKEKLEQEKIEKALNEINGFISIIDSYNKEPNRYKTVKSIELSALIFGSFALTYDKYKNNSNIKIRNKAEELRRKASALQIKEFPKMRKKYISLFKEKMWVHNIDVIGKGRLYSTIELIGGIFANNKNKLDTFKTIQPMLKLLRFDRANFKWYKYDDEYTYWDIDSLPDSKVAVAK